MSTDGLSEMLGRIDERTRHIQEDVVELKDTCKSLTITVNQHSEDLATIKERIANSNGCAPALTRKQKASAAGAIVAFVAAVITAVIQWFKSH
jgi:hypothetical protein